MEPLGKVEHARPGRRLPTSGKADRASPCCTGEDRGENKKRARLGGTHVGHNWSAEEVPSANAERVSEDNLKALAVCAMAQLVCGCDGDRPSGSAVLGEATWGGMSHKGSTPALERGLRTQKNIAHGRLRAVERVRVLPRENGNDTKEPPP